MKQITRVIFGVLVTGLIIGHCLAAQVLPVLKTGSQTFTNVTVVNVTDTHLFFQYAGGMDSVRLRDLDPELQKTFKYDSAKDVEPESATRVRDVSAVGSTASTARTFSKSDLAIRVFELPDGRKVQLSYPKYWARAGDAVSAELSGLHLTHPYPDSFSVTLAILPTNNPFARMATQDAVAIPGNYELRRAVETNLFVGTIEGPDVKGHYFGLTRKSHGKQAPAEMQGMVKLDEYQIYFSVESDDWKSNEAQAAVEMVRTAQFTTKVSASAAQ